MNALRSVTGLFLLTFVANFGLAQEEKDLKSLQGVWEVANMVKRGKELPPDDLNGITLEFAKNKLTLVDRGKQRAFMIKVDPTKKPKTIDLTAEDGPFKGKTAPCIYKIDGDTVTLCMPHDKNTVRPDAFKSSNDAEASRILFTLRRAKK